MNDLNANLNNRQVRLIFLGSRIEETYQAIKIGQQGVLNIEDDNAKIEYRYPSLNR
ncbi:MAG: hypothetical protein HN977_18185 [Gammaproteobacteria bacterium]|nr:hypothetical protein [Gammaproteobacteria bacterium]